MTIGRFRSIVRRGLKREIKDSDGVRKITACSLIEQLTFYWEI